MPQSEDNYEVLWGGPKDEGIVHVVRHLVKEVIPGLVEASKNIASRVDALERRDAQRKAEDQAKAERDSKWNDNFTKTVWGIIGSIGLLIVQQFYNAGVTLLHWTSK